MNARRLVIPALALALTAPGAVAEPRWLAGDHHVHSRYSVGLDESTDPPTPVLGEDAIYPVSTNAAMARRFGLAWMVGTDHGGPNHSRINRDHAYPDLLASRQAIPEVVQFYGMELDTPGGDHSTLIIAPTPREAEELYTVESRYAAREPWPPDPAWNRESRMLEALDVMRRFPEPPLVIANHPSRSAPDLETYGRYDPAELRAWNDRAPEVAVGMAGAPGHQAIALSRPGAGTNPLQEALENYLGDARPRGAYRGVPTRGGFDPMTAIVGGFWDSMLAEGRRWWITANSDSHVHYTEGGIDFWPGEYSKTWVWAEPEPSSILEGLRHGRVFVALGDLVDRLHVEVRAVDDSAGSVADLGQTLRLPATGAVDVRIRFRDPVARNAAGRDPRVARVDLIVGAVHGPVEEPGADREPTTRVAARFSPSDWHSDGAWRFIDHRLEVTGPIYLRVRGTSTLELEPAPDITPENPFDDLWFYGNPVFVEVAPAVADGGS